MSPDTWDDGATYEPYVGRWSRVVAGKFLTWLGVPAGAAWLDFGCGTGALSDTILTNANPRLVIGCDRSRGYVEFARTHIPDTRVQFTVAELPELPRLNGGFDAAVAGLVLNFLPAPAEGLTAMAARVRPGGTVAAYVWDYAEGMQLMRAFWDAAITSRDSSRRPTYARSRFRPSRSRPFSGTSATTGGPSWAARDPRPGTRRVCRRTARPSSERLSVASFRAPQTARSPSWREPGRSKALPGSPAT